MHYIVNIGEFKIESSILPINFMMACTGEGISSFYPPVPLYCPYNQTWCYLNISGKPLALFYPEDGKFREAVSLLLEFYG